MNVLELYRLTHQDERLRRERRRPALPDLARDVENRIVEPFERRLVRRHRRAGAPIVLIVGVPRSGTTILHQLMARQLDVAYVTNQVARWWRAPLWAMQHHRLPMMPEIALDSHLGAAEGDDAPHEFGWFWTLHLPRPRTDDLDDAALGAIDWGALAAELEAMAGWTHRPLVMKNVNAVDYQIAPIAEAMPGARFVHVVRDPRFVARSILAARRTRYGDPSLWWAVRPRDVEAWRDRAPEDQVVHQIADILRTIETSFAALPEERTLTLRYEDLVADPDAAIERLSVFTGAPLRGRPMHELRDGNVRRDPDEAFAGLDERLSEAGLWSPPPA